MRRCPLPRTAAPIHRHPLGLPGPQVRCAWDVESRACPAHPPGSRSPSKEACVCAAHTHMFSLSAPCGALVLELRELPERESTLCNAWQGMVFARCGIGALISWARAVRGKADDESGQWLCSEP